MNCLLISCIHNQRRFIRDIRCATRLNQCFSFQWLWDQPFQTITPGSHSFAKIIFLILGTPRKLNSTIKLYSLAEIAPLPICQYLKFNPVWYLDAKACWQIICFKKSFGIAFSRMKERMVIMTIKRIIREGNWIGPTTVYTVLLNHVDYMNTELQEYGTAAFNDTAGPGMKVNVFFTSSKLLSTLFTIQNDKDR